jgi:serine/threonine-protein kinase
VNRTGRYELLDRIAKGGMAELFRARVLGEQGFAKLLAVKRILPQWANDETFVAMLVDEARMAANLSHPNIVQVFDTEAAYATWFIVMEKLSGSDLAHLLQARGALPPAEAAAILRHLAAALAFAHSRGFVHRDIKPANVSIDEQGQVKLMDFGLAKAIPRDPAAGRAQSIDGTPQYIAPETALGRQVDGRADIYALGVMGFEMLSGRLPFEETEVVKLLKAHVCEEPPDLGALCPGLPASLVELVRRTLVKRPEERLSDWGEIGRLLDLGGAALGAGAGPAEEVLRVRFPPQARERVERAMRALVAELREEQGVEIARARLESFPEG